MGRKPVLTFCRTMFCVDCFRAGRAFKGDHFFTIGSTNQELEFRKASKWGVKGFTPHIITFDGVLPGNRVAIIASCAMLDCGWELLPNPSGNEEDMPVSNCKIARSIVLDKFDYLALRDSRSTEYHLD